MKGTINHIILWKQPIAFLASVLVLTIGCRKEVPASRIETNTYLKVYPAAGDQNLPYIYPTDDRGYLLVGNEGDSLIILKVDARGELQWKSRISDMEFSGCLATQLPDGNILISSTSGSGTYCKLDRNGNVLSVTRFRNKDVNNYFNNSYPQQLDNGNVLIAYSNGNATGDESTNKIAGFDKTGKLLGYIDIKDTTFLDPTDYKFKILWFSLHRCPKEGDYYFNGWAFLNWNGDWSRLRRMFVAHVVFDAGGTVTYKRKVWIDPQFATYTNDDYYQVVTSDTGVVLAATRTNKNYIQEGNVVKIDKDLNILWQTPLRITTYGTFCYYVNECPDGGYLVTGSCKVSDKTSDQPFACKLDRYGNIIWSKIYNTGLYAAFSAGIQNPDGTYLFGGSTTGFGAGATGNDFFVIKTDKDGNVN